MKHIALKKMSKLAKFIDENGWKISHTKKHMKLVHDRIPRVAFMPKTPSDFRSELNVITKLRTLQREYHVH